MTTRVNAKIISLLMALSVALSSPLVVHASGRAAAATSPNPTKLAWFYKPPADGNVTLVAQNYNTYIMTKGNETTRDQLISQGAQATAFLQYMRFEAIMDPGSCTAKPWQNNAAYLAGDFCTISSQHPDWFLLDTNGNRIFHLSGTTPFYHMDPGNSGWRAFLLQRVSQSLDNDSVWAGMFFDNVEVTNDFHVQAGENLKAYPDNASFQTAVQGFLQYMRLNYFLPKGKLLYANLVSRTDDALFTSYMTYLDGAMHEGWAIDDPNRYRSVSTWEKHLNLVEQAQTLGKPLILVSHGQQADLELQQFAYASYLLVTNGTTAFRYGSSAAYNQAWLYENYKLPLGAPLGPRYKVGTAWKRDFTNGAVSVDPAAHTAEITVTESTTGTTIIIPAATNNKFVFLPTVRK